MSQTRQLFYCPHHGLLSEREADHYLLEGHDGTMFGSTPDGDPYTGEFFCDLPLPEGGEVDDDGFGHFPSCGQPVVEVSVSFELPVD